MDTILEIRKKRDRLTSSAVWKVPKFLRLSCQSVPGGARRGLSYQRVHLWWKGVVVGGAVDAVMMNGLGRVLGRAEEGRHRSGDGNEDD